MKLDTITKPTSAVITVFVTLVVLLFAVGFLQIMTYEIIKTYFYDEAEQQVFVPDLNEAEKQTYRIQQARASFLPDGTVHLVEYYADENDINFGIGLEPEGIRVLNTEMEEMWTGKEEDNPHRYIENFTYPRTTESNNRRWREDTQTVTPEFSKAFVVPVLTQKDKVLSRWVYSVADRYFTGYETGGAVIGYFGVNGFSEDKEQVTAFDNFGFTRAIVSAGRIRSAVLTWKSPRKIYEIDFGKRTIETLIESKDEDIKFVVDLRYGKKTSDYYNSRSKPKGKPEGYRPAIGAVTESGKCYMLLQEPDERISFQMPKEWTEKACAKVSFTVFDDAIYLQHSGNNRPEWNKKSETIDEYITRINKISYSSWEEIYKLGPGGEIELLSRFDWYRLPIIKTHGTINYDPLAEQLILKKLTVASPIFYTWVLEIGGKYFMSRHWQNKNRIFREIIGGACEYLRPGYISATLVLSLAMAGVAFWHGWPRRRGWGEFGFWVAFVFVFNVAGLLTYLALNHVPVIHCYKCNKRRHIKALNCPGCGEQLPEPAAKPTDLVMA